MSGDKSDEWREIFIKQPVSKFLAFVSVAQIETPTRKHLEFYYDGIM